MNSAASQSSSSGCAGHSPCEPRSSSPLEMPAAEKLAPQTIDVHARSERIARRDQPVGQIEPCGAPPARIELAQKHWNGGLHDVAGFVHPVAARQNARLGGRGGFGHHHVRNLGFQKREAPLPVWPPRSLRAEHSGEAHWKCAAMRLRSSASACACLRRMRRALSTCSGISLPCSRDAGQEYSPAESARRKRPMVARRKSDSCCSRTVMTESASVCTGSVNRSARTTLVILVVGGDGPSGLGIAIDGAPWRILGRGLVQVGRASGEGQLCRPRRPRPPLRSSTKRSAPRATRMPGSASSCTTSMPSAVQTPAPGWKRHGVGFVIGIRTAGDHQAVAGLASRRPGCCRRRCVIVHRLVVVDLQHRAVRRLWRKSAAGCARPVRRPRTRASSCFSQSARCGSRLSILAANLRRGASSSAFNSLLRFCCSGVGRASCEPQAFASAVGHQAGLFDIGEERLHRIEVARQERVELVVVALGAAQRAAHPDGASGAHAVGARTSPDTPWAAGRLRPRCGSGGCRPRPRSARVVALGIRSPASCSRVNWSNGLLSRKACST